MHGYSDLVRLSQQQPYCATANPQITCFACDSYYLRSARSQTVKNKYNPDNLSECQPGQEPTRIRVKQSVRIGNE